MYIPCMLGVCVRTRMSWSSGTGSLALLPWRLRATIGLRHAISANPFRPSGIIPMPFPFPFPCFHCYAEKKNTNRFVTHNHRQHTHEHCVICRGQKDFHTRHPRGKLYLKGRPSTRSAQARLPISSLQSLWRTGPRCSS